MNSTLRTETRLFAIVIAIVLAYAGSVSALALRHGQMDMIYVGQLGEQHGSIIGASAAGVLLFYLLDLVLRRRPEFPVRVLASELGAQFKRTDWMLARTGVIVGWFGLIIFFTPFKAMIGHLAGFRYDHALADLDRALFLGHDPWQLTHAIFSDPGITLFLNFCYGLWFLMMWFALIYLVLRPQNQALRAQYLLTFMLSWVLIGSLGAWLLASAGPCYFERAFGDPRFAPLMQRLAEIDVAMKARGVDFWSLQLQDELWSWQIKQGRLFGGGISAMPSMHVAIAALMSCGGFVLDKRLGWALVGFTFLIWVASVHLGWHYAVDGIVAVAMTLVLWRFSGWLTRAWIMKPAATAAAPQAATV